MKGWIYGLAILTGVVGCRVSYKSIVDEFPFLTKTEYREENRNGRILRWRIYEYRPHHPENTTLRLWYWIQKEETDSTGTVHYLISSRPWKAETFHIGVLKYQQIDDDFDGKPEVEKYY